MLNGRVPICVDFIYQTGFLLLGHIVTVGEQTDVRVERLWIIVSGGAEKHHIVDS